MEEKVVYLWRAEESEVIYSQGHCPVELSSSHRAIKKQEVEREEENEKMVNCYLREWEED